MCFLIWMRTFWNRYKNVGSKFIFITLTFPATEIGRFFHLPKSNLHFSNNTATIFVNSRGRLRVTSTPKYLKEVFAILKGWVDIEVVMSSSIFWGNIILLPKLILYPESLPNWSNRAIIWGMECCGSDTKRSKSSECKESLLHTPLSMALTFSDWCKCNRCA